MVQINLNHIYKQYPGADNYSVTDFNMLIEDREFIVFVGPSGCGKSTTLRMIAGLEDISKGTLEIDGQIMNDVEPKDRDIAMVFQNYALYPHMTVFDNMAYGLKLRKFSKEEIDRRVRDAAEILGLEALLDRKPAALSGGQRQRVALGRAIVRDAKVFLMDEPLSNLDAKLRVQMRTEIAKLHNRLKTTSIYVTHDQTEAMTLASRIVVMNDGVIQQIGTPEEVYTQPENIFVAGFMGSPAMNFFDVTYQDGNIYSPVFNFEVIPPQRTILDNQDYQGKTLVFGIRPEDLHAEQVFLDAHPTATIEGEVQVKEMTGAETVLYIERDGVEWIARLDPRDSREIGEPALLGMNLTKGHFFDKTTGEVIK